MLSKLPTWLRASIITSVQTFVATFTVTLVGVLNDTIEWVQGGSPPELDVPTKAVVAALIAAVSGVVTAVHRAWRPPEDTYPEPPTA